MRYLRLLRCPAPLLLWTGQVTSTAGDRLYMMAILWLAYELTGSTATMAAVSLFETMPAVLVGLVGGALLDRWSRLHTMVAVDAIRAVLVLALPLAWWLGTLQPWHLMVTGLCMGALGALFQPALDAVLPGLVPAEDFPGLAGLMDTPSRLARLLGPGFAGLLLAIMPIVHFFTLDSVSFAVSAVCITLILRRTAVTNATPQQTEAPRHFREDLTDGWRHLRGSRTLIAIFTVDVVGNVGFAAYSIGALVLATSRLQAGAGGYGLLIAAYGAGSLAGNLVVGNAGAPRWRVPVAVGGWTGIGLGFLGLALAPSLAWAIGAVAVSGASGSMAHVSRATYIGQTVPDRHLAKVYSLLRLLTTLAGSAGTVLMGWLMDRAAPERVIGVTGIALAAVSLLTLAAVAKQAAAGSVPPQSAPTPPA